MKVMSAIESCRTAALGGHVARCEDCAAHDIAYNSCRNRHCPKCQGAAAREWMEEREAELLPVPYFHVVFTLPAAIGDIAYQNKARDLRPAVQGLGRDHAHDRRRPEAPGCQDRHHVGAAHLLWGIPCQARGFQFIPLHFLHPFSCSTLPEAFFSSRPRAACAVARRACQGWPLFGGHPGASPGLGLDTPEPDGIMDAFGVGLRACSPLDCNHSACLVDRVSAILLVLYYDRFEMTEVRSEPACSARRDRATSFYSVGWCPDHDAVMRIGSEAPKRRAHSGARHGSHRCARDTATSNRQDPSQSLGQVKTIRLS